MVFDVAFKIFFGLFHFFWHIKCLRSLLGCNNPISKLIIIPKGKWFKFLISNHSDLRHFEHKNSEISKKNFKISKLAFFDYFWLQVAAMGSGVSGIDTSNIWRVLGLYSQKFGDSGGSGETFFQWKSVPMTDFRNMEKKVSEPRVIVGFFAPSTREN